MIDYRAYLDEFGQQLERDRTRGEEIFSQYAMTMNHQKQSQRTDSTPASVSASKHPTQKKSSIPTAQEFEAMGYKERVALQSKSPEVYEQLQRQSWEADGENGKAFLEGFCENY